MFHFVRFDSFLFAFSRVLRLEIWTEICSSGRPLELLNRPLEPVLLHRPPEPRKPACKEETRTSRL
jgi:hypothetical protein